MLKADALEATKILQDALRDLLTFAPTRGRPGADLRTACGDLSANATAYLQIDAVGPPLVDCFNLARATGITQSQLEAMRVRVGAKQPVLLGAVLIKEALIGLCLASEGLVISAMTFVSRDDVDALKTQIQPAFNDAEEWAADDMAQMTYRYLVATHAAIIAYLADTARPLPRVLRFEFAATMSTLLTAQRLYYDAGRADELRAENHTVHPAFMLQTGRALSR